MKLKEILVCLSLLQLAVGSPIGLQQRSITDDEDYDEDSSGNDSDVDCGVLTIANGYVQFTSTAVGSEATYTCATGYTLIGPSMRTCQADGTWSGSGPTCGTEGDLRLVGGSNRCEGRLQVRVLDLRSTINGLLRWSTACDRDFSTEEIRTACRQLGCPTGNPSRQSISSDTGPYLEVGYQCSGEERTLQECQPISSFSRSPDHYIGLRCSAVVDCGVLTIANGQVQFTSTTFGSEATYTCATGYILNGPSMRTCQADGTWSGSGPTCGSVDCGPLTIANGQVEFTSTMFGSEATYTCVTGYILNGQSTRTCQADGTWSGNGPTCGSVDCGVLTIANGQVQFTSTTFGSEATYTCATGYTLIGPSMRTCQADGTWSGSGPTCGSVDCGVLSIANGQVEFTSTMFGSEATYTCVTGYTLNGPSTRTCQADGTWSGSGPTCRIVDCGVLTVANGQVEFTSTMFASEATYTCDTGYVLNGPSTRTCQADGTWSGSGPTCESVDCGVLTIVNGQVQFTSTTFGSEATYTCATGYTLIGPSMRTCQAVGTWSGNGPLCEIVDCGSLTSPSNGQLSLSTTTFGSVATYTCTTGYNLNGPNGRVCQENGIWSGSVPTCEVVNCNTPPRPANGQVTYSATSYNSVATYTCNGGYELSGGSTTIQRRCLASGIWSGTVPTCEVVNCNIPPRPANGQVTYSATTYNSVATYTCNGGYELSVGSTTIQRSCLASGTWSGSTPSCMNGGFAPFYRYSLSENVHDHFYTTNIDEIGTATHGQVGNLGYTSEGTECVIRKWEVTGSVPLHRYYHEQFVDHFYTTDESEIGTTTAGVIGNHGYRSEGKAGYCFSSQVPNTIPLFRYYSPSAVDHFYTTDSSEIGTTTPGQVGQHGYRSEGIECYVHPRSTPYVP